MWVVLLEALIKTVIVFGGAMTAAAYLVLLERWIAAAVQDRLGPNRVGIPLTTIRLWGLGQPIADGVKFFCKEEFTPGHVDRILYFAAPIVMFTSAILVFALIPFGSVLPLQLEVEGLTHPIQLVVAPGVDAGLVLIFAISGIGVYGVLLGGWSSNNKYSLYGGLRSGAQLLSYEIPVGLAALAVVLAAGSLRLDRIILAQAQTGCWNAFVQPLGLVVFLIAGCAEAGRLPFDLAEAEQELVGGYHTEYSGMKLMLYLVSEFLHMIAASCLIVVLYLGGWHFWFITGGSEQIGWITAFIRVGVFMVKVFAVILTFMIVRWSWPRFRFDQLMNLAWKVLLPWGLLNLLFVACWVEYTGRSVGFDMALAGWLLLAATWLATTWLAPETCDNRPRLTPEELKLRPDPRPYRLIE